MFGLEDITIPQILPLGAILFEFLFLLIAIPIEAYVFNNRLKFDKKTSMFYAISINLFSSTFGWLIFFFLEPILPVDLKSELISYIFFNTFRQQSTQAILILAAFIIFFMTFLMKFFILKFLVFSLNEDLIKPVDSTPESNRLKWRRSSVIRLQNTNLVTTVLIANSLSYSAISIILLLSRRTS
ncbi:MAG: filament integrity protein fraC [Trichormus sp. ATA11-4-KO1]|jgi:hypothetical protein|nr:filament integrity protein fraC [Trichormus sp. ATA11-4-KO1]